MNREVCVLCSHPLLFCFTQKDFPVTQVPPTHSEAEDQFHTQTFYRCSCCASIQLGTLVDPSVLYSSAHNNTMNTPTWMAHHQEFAEFVLRSHQGAILEIGGQGLLYTLMKKKGFTAPYTCLDLSEVTERHEDIKYIQGNGETYPFESGSTLLLSHVFEHFYQPRLFVENVCTSGVESVYISIPNMPALLEIASLNVISNEHTFYIDKPLIEWLFAQNGYILADYYEFRQHSLFFHFKRGAITRSEVPNRSSIMDQLQARIQKDTAHLQNVLIQPNSFLIPAGALGQCIIYFNKPSSILGFLDNDLLKQGKRVYGTPYRVFGMDELLKHDGITIYILAGPYQKELIQQIEGYKKSFTIIQL